MDLGAPSIEPFVRALHGAVVSHVWRGHGSALFVEFGELRTPDRNEARRQPQPLGAATLAIEWSWRIEKPRSILGGSWSSERRWQGMFEKLRGARVGSIAVSGALPEISVQLSNGLRIQSFMTAEGQPAWSLICRSPNLGALYVRAGRLCVELPRPGATSSKSR